MNRRAPSHLADEQAALRRVATLVASGATPEEVFQTVAEEAGRLLEARTAATVRFDPDCGLIVGAWSDGEGAGIEVSTKVPYSAPGSPVNRASHEGGRIDDYSEVQDEAARLTRLAGYLSSVVAPITAGGRLWGALFVFSASTHYFPADAEQRLADFTQLVALALESAEAHDQLKASRARIVEASVAERRRLERNLHDGAQQRLVTLSLHLRMAQECLREDPAAAEALLEGVGEDLKLALESSRSSRVAFTRRSSPTAGSSQPCSHSPTAPHSWSRSPLGHRPAFPKRSKRPSTTWSPKASPTRRNTRAPPKPRRALDDDRHRRRRDPRQRQRRREPEQRHRAERARRPGRGARRKLQLESNAANGTVIRAELPIR